MNKISAFYKYMRAEGPVSAIKRTARYGKRIIQKTSVHTGVVQKRKIDVMVSVNDVLKADFIDHPYKKPDAVAKEKLSIAWVLSPISIGSGGQNTIARFAKSLQKRGHNVMFFIYEGFAQQPASYAHDILKQHFHIDVPCYSIRDYTQHHFDVVFATGWETAYPVFNMDVNAHKFYFVQDYEPLFYGTGSKSVLAQNTYRFGFYGITAGAWLTQQVSQLYSMEADYFDFGADLEIYHPNGNVKKKKQICFYARPVTERRAFEIGVMALMLFHRKHPDYEIVMFGWDVSDYDIPFPYKNMGVVNHEQLAKIYQESVACLVLSLTNASLLPLELLASGCIPVMNDGDNNRLVVGENEYITYTLNSPIELAKGLESVLAQEDVQDFCSQAAESVHERSWDTSYDKFEKIILREVSGKNDK